MLVVVLEGLLCMRQVPQCLVASQPAAGLLGKRAYYYV
jgi:hypothetical protein